MNPLLSNEKLGVLDTVYETTNIIMGNLEPTPLNLEVKNTIDKFFTLIIALRDELVETRKELSLEQKRTAEQVRDKHRILNEYETVVKQLKDEIELLSEKKIPVADKRWCGKKLDSQLDVYEKQIGLYQLKKSVRDSQSKYWLACSPKWKWEKAGFKTEYDILYWVNYGDNETYGWFTVEQIILWLTTPNLKLHTLGGEKER